MKFGTALLMLAFSFPALAEMESIPTNEDAFMDVIASVDQEKLLELLGEPAEALVLRNQSNDEIIGGIVRYSYLNTNKDGEYYKTTELDYLDGKLRMVVFSNGEDGESATAALPQSGECSATC